MSDILTSEKADQCRRLRKRGFLWPHISAVVDLPVSVCIAVCERPEWPKVVTRIEADGSAMIVREV